jgi:phosphoglycerate dehydrogenase-like enzyme
MVSASHLGGVALDVHDIEPLPPDDVLRCHPSVLATPHMAWMTRQTVDRFVAAAAAHVREGSTGLVRRVV